MACSGVQVSDRAKQIHNEMKVVTATQCHDDRIRLVTFEIVEGEVVVKKVIRNKDAGTDCFLKFVEELENDKCCYILYDCHYNTTEGAKEDLFFFLWCDDGASIKDKMRYAASKLYVKKVFTGVKCDLTLNDGDCKNKLGFIETVLRRNASSILNIEGIPLSTKE